MPAIEKIRNHFVPEPNEKLVGHTPKGQPIYERTIDKGKSVPRLDEEGNQIWTKHQTTGEPLVPMRMVVSNPQVERFVPVDGGNGTVYREPWTPESEESIRRKERERKMAEVQRQLAEGLVENDISVDALLSVLKGGDPTEVESDDDGDTPEYPVNHAPGRWTLSDGTKMKGTKDDALAAEAALKGAPEF